MCRHHAIRTDIARRLDHLRGTLPRLEAMGQHRAMGARETATGKTETAMVEDTRMGAVEGKAEEATVMIVKDMVDRVMALEDMGDGEVQVHLVKVDHTAAKVVVKADTGPTLDRRTGRMAEMVIGAITMGGDDTTMQCITDVYNI